MDKFPQKGERENASYKNHNKAHQLSEKQLYDEINYHRAEGLSKKMLEKGLITPDEYDKLLVEIRKIFVPILAELL